MPLPWRQPAVEAASPGSPRAAKALTSSGLARRWEHLKPDPGHVTDPSRIGFERLPFHAGAWGGGPCWLYVGGGGGIFVWLLQGVRAGDAQMWRAAAAATQHVPVAAVHHGRRLV